MSSAICFNLDQSKILSSGYGFITTWNIISHTAEPIILWNLCTGVCTHSNTRPWFAHSNYCLSRLESFYMLVALSPVFPTSFIIMSLNEYCYSDERRTKKPA